MSSIGRRGFVAGGAGLALAAASRRSVRAQGGLWANRSLRFVVPLAAGGALDFVARGVGEVMTRVGGQQIVVENRTGAGGTIAMDAVLRTPPDGSTVLITNDNAASAPHVMGLSYDYTKELLPVILLGGQAQVLCAHPSLGVNTVAEFVAYAKANPGLGYASSGAGSNQHVIGEWLKREAGIHLDHVPYRGAGQAINDLVAGHVKSAILGPTAVLPHYKAGTVRILAQTAAKRMGTIGEIPTLQEAGFPGLVLQSWYGAFLPPGSPENFIQELNRDMAAALTDKTLRDNLTAGAVEVGGGSPQELGELARSDSDKYARLVKELRIRAG